MRPDRLVVGEVREAESLDLLIALNSGLPGMCSIHANSARDALVKLSTLPLLAGRNIDSGFVVPTVASAIDLVVHCELVKGGQRRTYVLPWVDDATKARDYAQQMLRIARYPEELLELTFPWKDDPSRDAMIAAELYQLVAYQDTSLGASRAAYVDDWYRVIGLRTNVGVDGAPVTTALLRPSFNYRNLDAIAWDDFNRANAASLGNTPTGKTWTTAAGAWSIASNKALDPTVVMWALAIAVTIVCLASIGTTPVQRSSSRVSPASPASAAMRATARAAPAALRGSTMSSPAAAKEIAMVQGSARATQVS
jgi:hypothetical protein